MLSAEPTEGRVRQRSDDFQQPQPHPSPSRSRSPSRRPDATKT